MKIKKEDFEAIEFAINDFIDSVGLTAIKTYRKKNNEIQFCWNLMYASGLNTQSKRFSYLTDTHIQTALKQIINKRLGSKKMYENNKKD